MRWSAPGSVSGAAGGSPGFAPARRKAARERTRRTHSWKLTAMMGIEKPSAQKAAILAPKAPFFVSGKEGPVVSSLACATLGGNSQEKGVFCGRDRGVSDGRQGREAKSSYVVDNVLDVNPTAEDGRWSRRAERTEGGGADGGDHIEGEWVGGGWEQSTVARDREN